MHLAFPIFLAGGRNPSRSATLIRRRTMRRNTRSVTATVLMSAVSVASASIVLAVVAGTVHPLPLPGGFGFLPNAASADEGNVDDGPAPLIVRSLPHGAR